MGVDKCIRGTPADPEMEFSRVFPPFGKGTLAVWLTGETSWRQREGNNCPFFFGPK